MKFQIIGYVFQATLELTRLLKQELALADWFGEIFWQNEELEYYFFVVFDWKSLYVFWLSIFFLSIQFR